MIVYMMTCRLHLAEAASNIEIEQQLAKPWSKDQVGDAFAATLTGWKARSKVKRMKGDCALMKLEHPHHSTHAAVQQKVLCCTAQSLSLDSTNFVIAWCLLPMQASNQTGARSPVPALADLFANGH